MPNNLSLKKGDLVYRMRQRKPELKPLLLLEKENIVFVKDILPKSTRLQSLVADASAGICSESKACLLLPKNRSLIQRDVDRSFVTEDMMQLKLSYTRQLLRKESNMDRENLFRSPTSLYVNIVQAIEVSNRLDACKFYDGCPSIQTKAPPHIPYNLEKYLLKEKLC